MHRYAKGYSPIANPVLFNSDEHCRNWFSEIRNSVGYEGQRLTCKCPQCNRFHSEWTWMDFQSFIDAKSRLSKQEQLRYLAKDNPLLSSGHNAAASE